MFRFACARGDFSHGEAATGEPNLVMEALRTQAIQTTPPHKTGNSRIVAEDLSKIFELSSQLSAEKI
jgi:hypothetical protein